MTALIDLEQSIDAVDVESAIATLTLAFSTDPAVRWTYPEPSRYLEWFPRFARVFAGKAFDHHSAHALPQSVGAALWLPPGIEPDEQAVVEVLQESVRAEQLTDMFALFEQMGRAHPSEPHWYLPLIGVEPARQGRGLGSVLLQRGLELCDRDRRLAYLEASNPEGISLYERHGFAVLGALQSGTSPVIYPMIRRPR